VGAGTVGDADAEGVGVAEGVGAAVCDGVLDAVGDPVGLLGPPMHPVMPRAARTATALLRETRRSVERTMLRS
jgi:hypothetical protein